MSVLVDTNVLLRRAQPDHAHNAVAIESIGLLLDHGEQAHFTLQNISEFWNVATRPIVLLLTLNRRAKSACPWQDRARPPRADGA